MLVLRCGLRNPPTAVAPSTAFSIGGRCFASKSSPRLREVLELGSRGGHAKFGRTKRAPGERWSAGSVAMLIIPAAAFGLGCWQAYRLRWKLGLIDQLELRLGETAIEFPVNELPSLSSMEYRRVRLRGRFLHEREFILSPRGRFDPAVKDESRGSLLSSNDVSSHGAHVITPFAIEGTNLVILVNRGWVPQALQDAEYRQEGQTPGTITIEAIVRKSETRPQFVGANIPERGVWFYKDIYEMARYYGTDPIYVEAVYESTVPGGPIGGQTNVTVRNEHLNYLITWYSLCAVTLAMWWIRFGRG